MSSRTGLQCNCSSAAPACVVAPSAHYSFAHLWLPSSSLLTAANAGAHRHLWPFSGKLLAASNEPLLLLQIHVSELLIARVVPNAVPGREVEVVDITLRRLAVVAKGNQFPVTMQ
jgi:hypothetical protein